MIRLGLGYTTNIPNGYCIHDKYYSLPLFTSSHFYKSRDSVKPTKVDVKIVGVTYSKSNNDGFFSFKEKDLEDRKKITLGGYSRLKVLLGNAEIIIPQSVVLSPLIDEFGNIIDLVIDCELLHDTEEDCINYFNKRVRSIIELVKSDKNSYRSFIESCMR